MGSADYYVTFRRDDDTWSGPVNLGEPVNTKSGTEYSPYVTTDGKYFFVMSDLTVIENGRFEEAVTFEGLTDRVHRPGYGSTDIYWIRADFIRNLKPW